MKKFLVISAVALSFVQSGFCSSNNKEAVEELFNLFNWKQMIDMTLESQLSICLKDPQEKQEAKKFALEHFDFDGMMDEIKDLYAEVYTEEELQQILDFYQSPVGVKTITQMPYLVQKSQEISNKYVVKFCKENKELLRSKCNSCPNQE